VTKFLIEGLPELQKKLEYKNTFEEPIKISIKNVTLKYERETKKSIPVQTGRLRSSVAHDIHPTYAIVGTAVKYAPFVEFGTSKMAARHVEGGSKRIKGTGPFTYAMQKLGLQDVISVVDEAQKRWKR